MNITSNTRARSNFQCQRMQLLPYWSPFFTHFEFQWQIGSSCQALPQSMLIPQRASAPKLPWKCTRSRRSIMPKRHRNRNFPAPFASSTPKSVCFPVCAFSFSSLYEAKCRPWRKFLRPLRRQVGKDKKKKKKFTHTMSIQSFAGAELLAAWFRAWAAWVGITFLK